MNHEHIFVLHRSLFPGDALEVEVQAPRKMTPKKKKLATKVKKTSEECRNKEEMTILTLVLLLKQCNGQNYILHGLFM